MESKSLRQPIVCVLGHVDHGKTSLLDQIRGTSYAKSEAGGITQRIGATDIDAVRIEKIAKDILRGGRIKIPGLLFIDTPGHVAFSNMRARGGALADIAILVIDINEGIMPQTTESINILKKLKTPFVVAANKIDAIDLFTDVKSKTFSEFIKLQRQEYRDELDRKIYDLVNQLYQAGFSADRYDRITDFSRTLAIVPISAKYGFGIPDLLMTVTGLAQRYLESKISTKSTDGLGTVIEVKRESSIGTILDTVLYQGKLKVGDQIAVNTVEGQKLTKVKSMQVNKGRKASSLVERERVSAAIGVRVVISDRLDVISGSPLIVVKKDPKKAFEEIRKESKININLSQNGVLVKADALGSLEALCYELNQSGISVRQTGIGNITKRDIMDAATVPKAEERVVIGFNVDVLPEARDAGMTADLGIVTGNVIYSIVQQTQEWIKKKRLEYEEMKKSSYPVPARIVIMEDHIFRTTKPVIAGVKVLSGRIKVGDTLIKSDGRYGGTIKSIRENEMSVKFAEGGSEVSVAIDGVTMNRQIHPGETLYVDMTEEAVKQIRDLNLDAESLKTLEEIIKIKRKENIFWGTKA